MTWRAAVRLIRELKDAVADARPSAYLDGYTTALDTLLEMIEDEMWREGEDDEDS